MKPAGEVLLATDALAKAFGPTRALRSCSFELRAGEVHAIMGENGSGKSTLVKILTGVHRPDSGSITLGEVRSGALRSPRAAIDAGIAAVFQETLVIGPRSVLENVWIGTDGLFRDRLRGSLKRARAAELLGELLGGPPDLDQPVEELSLSDRQACCIARALVRGPRILILDEATSALDVVTRDRLFEVLRRLSADGVGVIFISHRMDEIEGVGDRVTVMRSGTTVATVSRGEATVSQLVGLMTGVGARLASPSSGTTGRMPGSAVLEARGMRLRPSAPRIEFSLRAGELVGLAGLEGHGQDGFLKALRGSGAYEGEVVRLRDGTAVVVRSPRQAAARGIAYVPRERRAEAIFESLSVRENFAMPTLRLDTRVGLLRPRSSQRRLAEYVDRLGIKVGHAGDRITMLSGGNQQKVVVARWLAANPRILLLNDPTRGVDATAKRDLYELLARLTGEGVAVVMLSTELDELVELMDRVLVFREHGVFAELPRVAVTREALVAAFFGRGEARRV